ncbi:MAG: protein kinase [candidate division Zixibacteria bacterium]|nr:protein kinase [candidate division Zixibacteria bacterium]
MNRDNDNTQSFVALISGTEVGHYKIVEKIGAGGMGEVYLAEDTKLKRKVALKLLSPHLCQDEECRERFKREAQAAAKLDHPNIVPVYEVGEFKDRPYFAMAHIQGKSLRAVIKEGKLSISEAVKLTMQICEGLHKAHESGIVHRDIKPANIIIDQENRPRLLDFGLATVTGAKKLTKTGSTMGTLGYMSPEQIQGEKTDHRSDLFSVGVILYEMITGRTPFEGEYEAAIHFNIVNEEAEPLSRYKSGVPEALQQIVDKALTKDVSLRYQHADGMTADLKRLEVGSGPAKKSKLGLWAAVVAVILIVSFTIDRFAFNDQAQSDKWNASIAVLPFRDLSIGQDQAHICEGMAEAIIRLLRPIGDIKVSGLTSVLRFDGRDMQKIARELKVETVLAGRVAIENDIIRISTELINIEDGRQLWSESWERESRGIFAIQDEISQAIAEVLQVQLSSEDATAPVKHGTESIEAYNAYAQGRFFWRKRTLDGTINAKAFFKQAIELDSNFALAWSGFADSWTLLAEFDPASYPDAYPKAREAARTAIRIDSTLAEPHASLGLAQRKEGDIGAAIEQFEIAMELNPDYVWTHIWYGRTMAQHMRRKDIYIKHMKKALALDPLNIPALSNIAGVLSDSGLFDEAESYFLKLFEVVPENTLIRTRFARHYQKANQYDKAIEQYETAIEIEPNYWNLYYQYASLLVNIDQAEDAPGVFERAIALMPDSAGLYYEFGRLLFYRLGNTKEAIDRYNQAIEIDPQLDVAYNLLAYAYDKAGDFDQAIAAVQKAIEISPENAGYIDTRADIYYSFGYLDEAIDSYRQYINEKPNDRISLEDLASAAIFTRQYDLADSAHRVLAEHASVEYSGWGEFKSVNILRHQGRFRETVEVMKAKEKIIRQEVGVSNQLGGLFWNRAQIYFDWLKDYDKALVDLDSLEASGRAVDDRQVAHWQLESAQLARPLVYAMMGEYDSCDYWWEQVDSVKYRNYYYAWMGYIQLEKGNADSAIKCLQIHKGGTVSGAIENAWLGMAYFENEQVAKAVEYLEQGVFRYDSDKGVYPGYAVWYHYHLAKAYEAAGRTEDAITQYETFLDIWQNADEGLESVEDAMSRLAKLKHGL